MSDSHGADAAHPPYNPYPSAPRRRPPPGAWDTHFHTFAQADQKVADQAAAYRPTDAPMSALNAMHQAIGIDRGVLVLSTAVKGGYDPFIADLEANPRLSGVAVMTEATTDAELQRLHEAGVRGVRFHFAAFLLKRPPLPVFLRCVDRVAKLGWHVLVHVEPDDIVELADVFAALPVQVIIDHIGHVRVREGVQQPGFQKLLELQRLDHIWIKIANSDRWSATGAPSYADALPFGRAVIANGTDRLMWATDWPHVMYKDPRHSVDAPPDEGDLLNLLYDFADDDAAVIEKILVTNPLQLYGP